MILNGWKRLWIVVSAIMLPVAFVLALPLNPELSDVPHEESFYDRMGPRLRRAMDIQHVFAPPPGKDEISTEVMAQRWSNSIRRVLPNGHVMLFHGDANPDSLNEIAAAYTSVLERELLTRRVYFFPLIFMLWVLFCGAMYQLGDAVGMVVRWVYEGFKQS